MEPAPKSNGINDPVFNKTGPHLNRSSDESTAVIHSKRAFHVLFWVKFRGMSMMLLLIYFVLNAILFSTSVAFIITCFGSNAYKECFTQYGTLVFCRNFDVPDGHTGIALVSGNEQGHMVIKQLMLVHDSENGGDTCSTAGFLMYAIHNESFGSYLEDMHCIIRNEP